MRAFVNKTFLDKTRTYTKRFVDPVRGRRRIALSKREQRDSRTERPKAKGLGFQSFESGMVKVTSTNVLIEKGCDRIGHIPV